MFENTSVYVDVGYMGTYPGIYNFVQRVAYTTQQFHSQRKQEKKKTKKNGTQMK